MKIHVPVVTKDGVRCDIVYDEIPFSMWLKAKLGLWRKHKRAIQASARKVTRDRLIEIVTTAQDILDERRSR